MGHISTHVSQIRNSDVDMVCKLHPKPNNPDDAQAIAFKDFLDKSWYTTGYVVKEAVDEVVLCNLYDD